MTLAAWLVVPCLSWLCFSYVKLRREKKIGIEPRPRTKEPSSSSCSSMPMPLGLVRAKKKSAQSRQSYYSIKLIMWRRTKFKAIYDTFQTVFKARRHAVGSQHSDTDKLGRFAFKGNTDIVIKFIWERTCGADGGLCFITGCPGFESRHWKKSELDTLSVALSTTYTSKANFTWLVKSLQPKSD